MRALIQRVTYAKVEVNQNTIGEIPQGILALIGIEKNDGKKEVERLVERLLTYRIFSDADGKMNLSVKDISGGLLLVPQFTLAADTKTGTRPGFSTAMAPAQSKLLFDDLVKIAREQYSSVAQGEFGADMQISLCNDGPVTFLLET
ncbi:MAG: D-aminoacyl-tRNA deacylase [Gammaproteobacteria bacterium]